MKKIFLPLMAALLTTTAAFAQSEAHKQVWYRSMGPTVGLGHAWMSKAGGDREFKISPSVGLGMVYSRHAHWGFGADLALSFEGQKQEYAVNGGMMEQTLTPAYIRIPLKAIYFFNDYGDAVRPKIYAGPSFGFNVGENNKQVFTNSAGLETETKLSEEVFRTFDLGLQAGLGLNVRVSPKGWLNLDAGYYHGLLDAIEDNGAIQGNGAKNRNLRLNIGMMWGF